MANMCNRSEVHPDDAELYAKSANAADPSAVIAGVRWVPCPRAPFYPDPMNKGSVVCLRHLRETQDTLRKIEENDQKAIERIAQLRELYHVELEKQKKKIWISYPERCTVTIGRKENKVNSVINPDGPFQVHMLNEEGKRKATTLSLAFQEMLNLVLHTTRPQAPFAPSLRDPVAQGYPAINDLELTQFILKLQEASFYAKRAMAMLPENQQ